MMSKTKAEQYIELEKSITFRDEGGTNTVAYLRMNGSCQLSGVISAKDALRLAAWLQDMFGKEDKI